MHDARRQWYFGEHGGREEIADIADPLATGHEPRLLLDNIGHQCLERCDTSVVSQRTELDAVLLPVALKGGLHRRGKARQEKGEDLLLHQKARGRDRDLARIAQLAARHQPHGLVEIGIGSDDDGGMTAQFHCRALHLQAC
ncbi:hypothetical protein A9O63_12630 [Cereibacter johrii]|nr:hypothetical protein A9O63_12630 [Cereibacter johrii]